MMTLSVSLANSVTKEERQNIPEILSPQQFKCIPAKGKIIEVRIMGGEKLRVKTVSRHMSSTRVTIDVIPVRTRKKK
ncbi:MAG: hypothetical protein AB1333_00195 [Patescibacteria group bacterium]